MGVYLKSAHLNHRIAASPLWIQTVLPRDAPRLPYKRLDSIGTYEIILSYGAGIERAMPLIS